jgi:multicomponent K+:H+ antiporter subunit E
MKQAPWVLILGLVGMWLLLNGTLSLAHILLGLVLAIVMVVGFRPMRPVQPRIRRPLAAIRLMFRVLIDIMRSNIGVGRVILGLVGSRQVKSGFLKIPLDLRDPHGLAALAAIVTSTPGTVWVDLTRDGSVLTLHVLDLQDEEAWIHTIKDRYERLLMEIFE